jgi:hypothetical protein
MIAIVGCLLAEFGDWRGVNREAALADVVSAYVAARRAGYGAAAAPTTSRMRGAVSDAYDVGCEPAQVLAACEQAEREIFSRGEGSPRTLPLAKGGTTEAPPGR